MKNWWEKIKKHPIYSGLTVFLVGNAIIAICSKVFFWNIFSSIKDFAIEKYTSPLWYFVLIGILPITLLLGLIFFLRNIDKQPDWMSYTEDIIYGVLWQWKYRWDSIESIDNDDLIPLCPQCKRELALIAENNSLRCINCDFHFDNIPGKYRKYKDFIVAEIQGRIRNGEYKDKIKKVISGYR